MPVNLVDLEFNFSVQVCCGIVTVDPFGKLPLISFCSNATRLLKSTETCPFLLTVYVPTGPSFSVEKAPELKIKVSLISLFCKTFAFMDIKPLMLILTVAFPVTLQVPSAEGGEDLAADRLGMLRQSRHTTITLI